MSRRSHWAAFNGAHTLNPSRRALIVAATAAPIFAGSDADPQSDQTVAACENWIALDAERDRLARRWSTLEARLAREHNFLKLSRRQQRALSEARELDDMSDRLDAIHDEQRALLKFLPTLAATSPFGLAGKLEVAAIEICPEENREAHDLIASILRDLKAMMPVGAQWR